MNSLLDWIQVTRNIAGDSGVAATDSRQSSKKSSRLSYANEIKTLNSQITENESQLRKAQEELNFLSDGSEERNAIQLEITKLQK